MEYKYKSLFDILRNTYNIAFRISKRIQAAERKRSDCAKILRLQTFQIKNIGYRGENAF